MREFYKDIHLPASRQMNESISRVVIRCHRHTEDYIILRIPKLKEQIA